MLMQTFGVTNKEHYCMLWYFLEWSIGLGHQHGRRDVTVIIIITMMMMMMMMMILAIGNTTHQNIQ